MAASALADSGRLIGSTNFYIRNRIRSLAGATRVALCLFIYAFLTTPLAAESLERIEFLTTNGARAVDVEVARTLKQREIGLMYRRSMPKGRGMLFLFGVEEPVAMWMKNTYIPLDMVFVSRAGQVTAIAANAEPMSEKIIPSGPPAFAVVELNAGAATEMGLNVGDRVRHPAFGR